MIAQGSDSRFRLGPRACRTELRGLGTRRRAALAEVEGVLDRIEELLPQALSAGLSLSEVARLTGVSRPTLYAMKRRDPKSGRRWRP